MMTQQVFGSKKYHMYLFNITTGKTRRNRSQLEQIFGGQLLCISAMKERQSHILPKNASPFEKVKIPHRPKTACRVTSSGRSYRIQRSKRLIKAESKSCFLRLATSHSQAHVREWKSTAWPSESLCVQPNLFVAQMTVVFLADENPSTF